jgi:hypothetical protein
MAAAGIIAADQVFVLGIEVVDCLHQAAARHPIRAPANA